MFYFIELTLIVISSITLFTTIVLFVFYKYGKGKEKENLNLLSSVSIFVPYYNEEADILLRTLSYIENQT